jgi:hypothetical protein
MAEGDYPGGQTPWESYDVPYLAGVLTENLGPAWNQVRAWYDTAGMAATYLDALRRFREDLAKVWPPERSPAAKAYLAQVDSLIASVDDVRDAASGNGEALNGVLSSLEGAKPQMQRWLEEWQQNEAAASSASQQPEYWTPGQPWQVELNQKAQQHMHELDAAVFPYQSRMRSPQPWVSPRVDRGDDQGVPAGGSGDSAGGSGGGGTSARDGSVRPPSIPPVPPLDSGGPGPGPAGGPPPASSGPVLTGGPGPAPGLGSSPAPGDMPVAVGPVPGSAPSGSLWVDTPAGRALRAGAVIGMPPPPAAGSAGADGARPGGRPSGASSSAAVGEPIGASERTGNGMLGGGAYGGAPRSGRDRRGRRSEPYVEWEVRKGVPPVLEPGPEPTHDPGPGVIGIDR